MNELPFIAIQNTFKDELKVNKVFYHQVHFNRQLAFQENLVLFFIAGNAPSCTFRSIYSTEIYHPGDKLVAVIHTRHFWVSLRSHMYTLIAGKWNRLA